MKKKTSFQPLASIGMIVYICISLHFYIHMDAMNLVNVCKYIEIPIVSLVSMKI